MSTIEEKSHGTGVHDAYGDKLLFLPGLGVVFFGLAMYNLVKQNIPLGVVFGALFLVLLMVYFYYRASQPAHPDLHPEPNLQMWGFLASEVIFFTAIIGLSQILRILSAINGEFWGTPGEILDIPITAINTFILICSSLTMVLAQDAVSREDYKKMKLYLLATFLIGATFLSIQVFEYNQLMSHHLPEALQLGAATFTPNHSLYAATFYLQTGFHGFHVTIGLIALLGVIMAAYKGKFTKENSTGLNLMGLYWHFVDLVWIILFAIVYLI